jgi:carboxypeptidase Q
MVARARTLLVALLVLAGAGVTGAVPHAGGGQAPAVPPETAALILGRALTDDGAWRRLEHLTTRIGNRLSGSPTLEHAIRWAARGMGEDGLENVRLQPVRVPRWVRGREWARVVAR